MPPKTVHTDSAPAAVGPYSQAIKTDSLVFCSGQLGLIPGTKELPESIEAQTRQALSNLKAVLEEAGTSLGNVVKTTVFLIDMEDFQAMNGVYGDFFGETRPARATIAVRDLPLGGMVEIEATAVLP